MSGDLEQERDGDTLYRLGSFFYEEGRRCRWWQVRRASRLHHAFWAVHAVQDELRARGALRSPSMFTATDDPHVTDRAGGDRR